MRKLSLQAKIISIFTIVIILTISTIVLQGSHTLRNAVKETYVSQLKGITTAINGRYEENRSINDVQQTFDYIKHREEKVLELNLYTAIEGKHQVAASTDRSKLGNDTEQVLAPTFNEGKTMVAHFEENGVFKVRLVSPLLEDGVVTGAIELLLDNTDDMKLVNQRILFTMVGGLAVSIILLVVLWFSIRRLLVWPLMTLREAALTIQQGKPYEELELNASQEINEVAHAFNDMVVNLEDRYYKSITDPLTGAFNSAYFKHKLAESIQDSKKTSEPMALLFCDVDNFKKLNDNEGHMYGDKVLKEITNLILDNVRSTDIVCRYGGEEFVVIMPATNSEKAKVVADQIRNKVSIHGNKSVLTPITISIGIALYPDDTDEENIVHLADQAMYTAKGLGKNRVILASEMNIATNKEYQRKLVDQRWIFNTVLSLTRAVEIKDSYTHSHSEMVSRYAATVASSMGLKDEEVHRVSIAGLLHDVGKIGVPDSVLNKEGRLTKDEFDIMKTHPVLGYNILANVEELKDILPYVLYHHERPDGTGYPNGLRKDEIPLGARIIGVVDAFHSMTSARPYRKAPLTLEKAINELNKGKGTQFDEEVVDTFLTLVDDLYRQSLEMTS
ncbi:diguanylate cyclase [Bacillus luteolus]|uniref:Diguanylate cyclase n=1 Tax=Litchfieldia luteola TaxID=682179 RepID=A0ABR9QH35_9BACI|nr:diguanylate cyclase [Cytobacillus luteolus]MBE4907808.1 diguanylate cyclase [Cytobacillus luteolus]MBP1944035.1 diguanylate cyclase (GGDEF)-like protein/putative nucleotidyltransferase with HDIG domain [Cytobacillus luteolus]